MKTKTLEQLLAEAARKAGITVEDLCAQHALNDRTLRRCRRENTAVRAGTIAQLRAATGMTEEVVRRAISASREAIALAT